ncbi:polyphosphate kinase 2 family protein [Sphingomonas xanthus]|uniref:Polyphosphate kinase n=1 Tax=Sphingomonas xanthus TaxID=2594473 RepID=A0A516ITP2_9SPHN|nr:polyphosphate kinase [Sphingomonas xanthus]QDP20275.1 polyphosphate kinase [Sphingomonas xanthus]
MPIELTDFERGAPFPGDPAAALSALQARLARLQLAQIVHRRRSLILFEGWTGSGKKAALKLLAGSFDPSHVQVRSVGGLEEADDDRHWLAPFWSGLPAAGDTTIFYHSWYRRIIEQRVSGRYDDRRWARACDEINEFEAQQRDHGTIVAKLFFHVSADQQIARLRERQADPWERHLLGEEDLVGLGERDQTVEVLHDLFRQTDTRWAPWQVIDGNDEVAGTFAALTAIIAQLEKALPAEPPAEGATVIQFPQQKAS